MALENTSVSEFFRASMRRADGLAAWVASIVIVALVVLAFVARPLFPELPALQRAREDALPLLILPALMFSLYGGLNLFSLASVINRWINALIIGAVAVAFLWPIVVG